VDGGKGVLTNRFTQKAGPAAAIADNTVKTP
jgi:hypothetical protein